MTFTVKQIISGTALILLSFGVWASQSIWANASVNKVQAHHLETVDLSISEFKSEIRFLSDTIQEQNQVLTRLVVTLENKE